MSGSDAARKPRKREELAYHVRSYVPADVVLDPKHVRALRLEREAKRHLPAADVAMPSVNLARYDAAVGVIA